MGTGWGGEGVRIDRAGGGREMTMATDARKEVSEVAHDVKAAVS